jgi:hypothetical protein
MQEQLLWTSGFIKLNVDILLKNIHQKLKYASPLSPADTIP